MKFTGRWTARVEQEFEVEADTEADARTLVEAGMEIRNVAELLDFEIVDMEANDGRS